MNGIRVIRTIAFDLTIGSEVIVNDKTHTVRGFDLERGIVTLETGLDDVFLKTDKAMDINKRVRDMQFPISKVIGTGAIMILRDKLLTIGDIPYGQPISDNK